LSAFILFQFLHAQEKPKVLYLSDSLSIGLYARDKAEDFGYLTTNFIEGLGYPTRAEIVSGSAPSAWVEGSALRNIRVAYARNNHDADGYRHKDFGKDIGFMRLYPEHYFPSLKEVYRDSGFDMVVIETATAFLDQYPEAIRKELNQSEDASELQKLFARTENGSAFESHMKTNVDSFLQTLDDLGQQHNKKIGCVFILHPRIFMAPYVFKNLGRKYSDDKNEAILERLSETMKHIIGDRCAIVDSNTLMLQKEAELYDEEFSLNESYSNPKLSYSFPALFAHAREKDGIHYGGEGQAIWFDLIQDALQQALKEVEKTLTETPSAQGSEAIVVSPVVAKVKITASAVQSKKVKARLMEKSVVKNLENELRSGVYKDAVIGFRYRPLGGAKDFYVFHLFVRGKKTTEAWKEINSRKVGGPKIYELNLVAGDNEVMKTLNHYDSIMGESTGSSFDLEKFYLADDVKSILGENKDSR